MWYRQNMFVALRGPAKAGTEDRIKSVIDPEFLNSIVADSKAIEEAKNGYMLLRWYLITSTSALVAKIQRRCHWGNHRLDMEE